MIRLMVTIDLNNLEAAIKETERVMKGIGPKMLNEVRQGAIRDQYEHEYRNRTGNLEKSTKGRLVRDSAKESRATLSMDMPYASFVLAKGLTDIEKEAKITEAILTKYFEHMLDHLSNL